MKKSFIDLCKSPLLLSFFVFIGVVGLFEFVVWPGLTVANTMFNILSLILGVLTLGFTFYFIKNTLFDKKIEQDLLNLILSDEEREPETELDYDPSTTKGTKPTKETDAVKKVVKRKQPTKKPKKNGTNKVGLK